MKKFELSIEYPSRSFQLKLFLSEEMGANIRRAITERPAQDLNIRDAGQVTISIPAFAIENTVITFIEKEIGQA